MSIIRLQPNPSKLAPVVAEHLDQMLIDRDIGPVSKHQEGKNGDWSLPKPLESHHVIRTILEQFDREKTTPLY